MPEWMGQDEFGEEMKAKIQAAALETTPYGIGPEQQGMMEMLRARAAGTGGPSAAEMQLDRSRESNIAALMAARASQRGMAPGAAQRQMTGQMAQETQVASGQAAQLRAQEQLGAEGMYAQTMMQERELEMQKQNEEARMRAEIAKAQMAAEAQKKAGLIGAAGSLIGGIFS